MMMQIVANVGEEPEGGGRKKETKFVTGIPHVVAFVACCVSNASSSSSLSSKIAKLP